MANHKPWCYQKYEDCDNMMLDKQVSMQSRKQPSVAMRRMVRHKQKHTFASSACRPDNG
jgi:hypothetical protein